MNIQQALDEEKASGLWATMNESSRQAGSSLGALGSTIDKLSIFFAAGSVPAASRYLEEPMNLIESAKKAYEESARNQAIQANSEGHLEMTNTLAVLFGADVAAKARINTVEGTNQTQALFEGMEDSMVVLFIERKGIRGYDGIFPLQAMKPCPDCGAAMTSYGIQSLTDLGATLADRRWMSHVCDGFLLDASVRYITFQGGDTDAVTAKANLWIAKSPNCVIMREHTTETIGDTWSSFTITIAYHTR